MASTEYYLVVRVVTASEEQDRELRGLWGVDAHTKPAAAIRQAREVGGHVAVVRAGTVLWTRSGDRGTVRSITRDNDGLRVRIWSSKYNQIQVAATQPDHSTSEWYLPEWLREPAAVTA
jgi:hypothetical protein